VNPQTQFRSVAGEDQAAGAPNSPSAGSAEVEDVITRVVFGSKDLATGYRRTYGICSLDDCALWNFKLNRRRNAALREEELKSVVAALYREIRLLRAGPLRLHNQWPGYTLRKGLMAITQSSLTTLC
jgi:hypothetical protein